MGYGVTTENGKGPAHGKARGAGDGNAQSCAPIFRRARAFSHPNGKNRKAERRPAFGSYHAAGNGTPFFCSTSD